MKLTKKRIILFSSIAVVLIAAILITVFFTKPILSYKAVRSYKIPIWSDINGLGEVDETASKEMTVFFNGVEYTGEYYRTEEQVPYTFAIHKYKGDEADFEINAETGELVYLSFNRLLPENSTADEEYCRKVADELADDYINLKRYKVDLSVSETGAELFTFDYYIEKGGYKTADALRISVDGEGNIKNFRKYMLGSFENVLYVKKPNEKRVEKAFDELFSEAREAYPQSWYEWEEDTVTLIKTPDGKIAYLYYVGFHDYKAELFQILLY